MDAAPFRDRQDAGRLLARRLGAYAGRPDVLVLALPRGGVPVAFEVAQALRAPLDVLLVRKLGVPGHEELAMGAIASGGAAILNDDVVDEFDIPRRVIEQVTAQEKVELERRERAYRDDRPEPPVRGRIVILVDDGLATGATMRAAVYAVQRRHPSRLIVAVPTAASSACGEFGRLVDEIVCVMTPEPFQAVGLWYENFEPVTDDEVRALLQQGRKLRPGTAGDRGHTESESADMNDDKDQDAREPQGRRDEVGRSGVYPASEAESAPADAQAQGMASWGQGERGAEGYEDHGDSEVHPTDDRDDQARSHRRGDKRSARKG